MTIPPEAVLSGASEPGHAASALVLLAFLASFLFIRTSARMIRAEVSWWPGNVETESGLHLHHLVWGISFMLIGGFTAVSLHTPSAPWYQLAVVLFGLGAGLTFDEFALWVHLEDVYWSDRGRLSLDAVVVVALVMGLVVIGFRPFGLVQSDQSVSVVLWGIGIALAFSLTAVAKGRYLLGVVALVIPGVGLWCALRLARPSSPWARRRYAPEKLARAAQRFPPDSRGERFRAWLFDAVGGRPTDPSGGDGA